MAFIEQSPLDTDSSTRANVAVEELRSVVSGAIVAPSDQGYAETSRTWNGAHDGRRPAVVVRCESASDVAAAVGIARRNEMPIAVRGGGHSVAGFSTGDDVVVI